MAQTHAAVSFVRYSHLVVDRAGLTHIGPQSIAAVSRLYNLVVSDTPISGGDRPVNTDGKTGYTHAIVHALGGDIIVDVGPNPLASQEKGVVVTAGTKQEFICEFNWMVSIVEFDLHYSDPT